MIESTSQAFGASIEKAKALGQDAQEMAASLDQLGQEAQAEAQQLHEEAKVAYQAARQAEMN
jgi:F0F1-type ATP synthase membrane subunit b/b'